MVPLAPGRLLYFPPGAPPLDPARPIIVCEGASSTDHARRHGLQAIGHTGSTCAESLQRDSLPRDGRYCIWADADAAGERQAGRVAGEMRAAGLTVAVLEPRVLFGGDVPDKADAGDWRPGDDPEAEIVAAVRPAGAEPAEPGPGAGITARRGGAGSRRVTDCRSLDISPSCATAHKG